ncbi:hypothetical protein EBR21_02770, partial [bacterium]|nr:hypothetical protein [bacterium]
MNLDWVRPIARQVSIDSELFAKLIASLLITLSKNPRIPSRTLSGLRERGMGLAFIATLAGNDLVEDFEKALHQLAEQWSSADFSFLESDDFVKKKLTPTIRTIASLIEKNPRLVHLLFHIELLEQELGNAGKKIGHILKFLPVVSNRAAALFPEIREQCFTALFRLSESDRSALSVFADGLMKGLFTQFALPRLEQILNSDPRGKVIIPFLHDVLDLVPPESSLNIFISTICTPREQLTPSRLLSIAIQELGGLYLKTSQVLAEMCPPNLAKELRSSQDAAAGVFPSVEKSFAYLLSVLNQPEVKEQWENYLDIPGTPVPHFAAASVGAIYELKFNAVGKQKFSVETLLVKIQRPGLHELLEIQATHLSHIARSIQGSLDSDRSLGEPLRQELKGMCDALLRGITH